MNRLRHMAVFAHIVECGSISAAAEQLALSKSVVSQHLKSLETALGVTLLKRTTRRQSLTGAGQQFYQQCQQLNQLADHAWQQALDSQQAPRGPITITAPHALMSTVVVPAIAGLLERWPALEPQLRADDVQLDLMEENIDLAIRVGSSTSSRYRQRRIGEFRDVLCGNAVAIRDLSPRYIANQWQGQQIEHRLRAADSEQEQLFEARPGIRADSILSCQALLEAGAGIGILPDFIFNQNTALQEYMPGYQLPPNPIYVLHPYSGALPFAVETAISAIEQQLATLEPG